MTNKRKGQISACKEWAKHIRKRGKKHFWKSHRQTEKIFLKKDNEKLC